MSRSSNWPAFWAFADWLCGAVTQVKGRKYLLINSDVFNYSLRSWLPNTQHYQRAVVKALTQVILVFGITKIVQSDRGTNFTSSMFTEILKLLQVKHAQSNPYHPQSQGAIERFHQTLKSCCVLIVRKWIVTGRRDCLPITVGRRNQNNEGLAHASGTRSYSGWDWVQPKLIGLWSHCSGSTSSFTGWLEDTAAGVRSKSSGCYSQPQKEITFSCIPVKALSCLCTWCRGCYTNARLAIPFYRDFWVTQ